MLYSDVPLNLSFGIGFFRFGVKCYISSCAVIMTAEQFCLRWNNHQSTLVSVFDGLFESGTLVDCTLAADGQYLKAHKVVLSACSPYLEVNIKVWFELFIYSQTCLFLSGTTGLGIHHSHK